MTCCSEALRYTPDASAVVVAGALLFADTWSLPYSSVLAGLGVGGLALALAAKDTVQNMIAGFTLFASALSVSEPIRWTWKSSPTS